MAALRRKRGISGAEHGGRRRCEDIQHSDDVTALYRGCDGHQGRPSHPAFLGQVSCRHSSSALVRDQHVRLLELAPHHQTSVGLKVSLRPTERVHHLMRSLGCIVQACLPWHGLSRMSSGIACLADLACFCCAAFEVPSSCVSVWHFRRPRSRWAMFIGLVHVLLFRRFFP